MCAGAASVTLGAALIDSLDVKSPSAPLVTWALPEVLKLQDLRAGLQPEQDQGELCRT